MPAAAGLEITGTRVSISYKRTQGRKRVEVLGLIHCGGATFIDH
jgi:hypothetical protein